MEHGVRQGTQEFFTSGTWNMEFPREPESLDLWKMEFVREPEVLELWKMEFALETKVLYL